MKFLRKLMLTHMIGLKNTCKRRKMSLRQLTTEVRNQLQLTTEVPSAVNCRRKKERKKKKNRSALKCRRTHIKFFSFLNIILCYNSIIIIKQSIISGTNIFCACFEELILQVLYCVTLIHKCIIIINMFLWFFFFKNVIL